MNNFDMLTTYNHFPDLKYLLVDNIVHHYSIHKYIDKTYRHRCAYIDAYHFWELMKKFIEDQQEDV